MTLTSLLICCFLVLLLQVPHVDEDDLDRPYPASNVHDIHIEPPLPLLECRVQPNQADSDSLCFLVGERGDLTLRLTNRGSLPIADVDVRLQPMFVQNSEQKQKTYYSEEELKAEQALNAAALQPTATTFSPPLPFAASVHSSPSHCCFIGCVAFHHATASIVVILGGSRCQACV